MANSQADQTLVARALEQLQVDRRARDAGVANNPPEKSNAPDANEQAIAAWFSAELRAKRQRVEAKLQTLATDRQATAQKIDITETRFGFARLLNSCSPEVTQLKQREDGAMRAVNQQEEQALLHLRWFRQSHGLQTRDATYPPSLLMHLAIVAVIALVEWIGLAALYGEGSDYGLLGGIMTAALISVTNIAIAVTLGSVLTYLNHRSLTRKVLAITGALILSTAFLMVSILAAHYRAAIVEATKTSELSEPAASSSSAAVTARAAGTGEPLVNALARVNPGGERLNVAVIRTFDWNFSHFDTLSWILLILTISFGIFAAWKGYRMDDPYPGYGLHHRHWKVAASKYQEQRTRLISEFHSLFDRILSEHKKIFYDVKQNIEYYKKLCGNTMDEISGYRRVAADYSDANRVVIAQYRATNGDVAIAPRPGYFKQPAVLDPTMLAAPIGLSSEEEALRKSYEGAIQEFAQIAEDNDKKIQDLRVEETKNLNIYLDDLQRQVRQALTSTNGPQAPVS